MNEDECDTYLVEVKESILPWIMFGFLIGFAVGLTVKIWMDIP